MNSCIPKNRVWTERVITSYYMAKPVLGKSQRSDWFFLGRDFAVRTISVEGPSRAFLFWSKAGKFIICNQNSKKEKTVNIVILHSETTRIS